MFFGSRYSALKASDPGNSGICQMVQEGGGTFEKSCYLAEGQYQSIIIVKGLGVVIIKSRCDFFVIIVASEITLSDVHIAGCILEHQLADERDIGLCLRPGRKSVPDLSDCIQILHSLSDLDRTVHAWLFFTSQEN